MLSTATLSTTDHRSAGSAQGPAARSAAQGRIPHRRQRGVFRHSPGSVQEPDSGTDRGHPGHEGVPRPTGAHSCGVDGRAGLCALAEPTGPGLSQRVLKCDEGPRQERWVRKPTSRGHGSTRHSMRVHIRAAPARFRAASAGNCTLLSCVSTLLSDTEFENRPQHGT